MLITDPKRPDNPIVFVNDAFARLTGYARSETLGRNCRLLQGPDMNTKDVARLRDAIERRMALAGAHDVLTNAGWQAARLAKVVQIATAPFQNSDNRRLFFGGDEVLVTSRAATSIALALHELATNAVKYGALSNDAGVVTINWHVEDEVLNFVWTESGGPVVDAPTRTGFGSRMIEQVLSTSIHGTANLQYRPAGVIFSFRTELASLAEPTFDEADNGQSKRA